MLGYQLLHVLAPRCHCQAVSENKGSYVLQCFLGSLCYLSFSVVSDFKDDFLYASSLMYFVHFVTLE